MLRLEQQFCDIFPEIYFVPQPHLDADYIVWPIAIMRPRCIGSCATHPELIKCVAKKKGRVTIPAIKFYYGHNRALSGTSKGMSSSF